MMEKIKALPMMVYLACLNFVDDMKKDERGLSDAVTAVLLILVAVLAVVLLWGLLSGWLQDLWTQITDGANDITMPS